jgi:ribosomal-protein-alanine N-acetyltransferase
MTIVKMAVASTASHAKTTRFLYGPRKDNKRRWVANIQENVSLLDRSLSYTYANVKYDGSGMACFRYESRTQYLRLPTTDSCRVGRPFAAAAQMITTTRYRVRPMTEADIVQVAAIERESFPTTWPQTAYKRELANNLARYLVVVDRSHPPVREEEAPKRAPLFGIFSRRDKVPQTTDYIAGYVGVWLMVDQAHIVAIAVREDYRGLGLGELLLAEAIDLALENHQESVTLEVRKSNFIAQRLYEKYRFLKVGTRRRYYSDNHEDAVIMTTPPIQDEPYTEHLAYLRDAWMRRWGTA